MDESTLIVLYTTHTVSKIILSPRLMCKMDIRTESPTTSALGARSVDCEAAADSREPRSRAAKNAVRDVRRRSVERGGVQYLQEGEES